MDSSRSLKDCGSIRSTKSNAAPGGLVLVAGSDAPAGGADFLVALHLFTTVVDQLMIGHDHVGPVADHEHIGAGGNAFGFQVIDFADQHFRIHDDPVADDAYLLLENARRDQVADELLSIHHHGVPGIVPSLKPNHHIGVGGQQIHNLTFPFIAPLGPNDYDICHFMLLN
jgi:hypothetical protein